MLSKRRDRATLRLLRCGLFVSDVMGGRIRTSERGPTVEGLDGLIDAPDSGGLSSASIKGVTSVANATRERNCAFLPM